MLFYFEGLHIQFTVSTIVRYILFETQIYHLANKSNESIIQQQRKQYKKKQGRKRKNFSNIHSLIIYGNMIKIYSFEFSIKVKQKNIIYKEHKQQQQQQPATIERMNQFIINAIHANTKFINLISNDWLHRITVLTKHKKNLTELNWTERTNEWTNWR